MLLTSERAHTLSDQNRKREAEHVVRQKISRSNDYQQAGERYRTMEDWERNDLITNLVGALTECNPDIQERMIGHLTQCDEDYGRRVAEGLGRRIDDPVRGAVASR